MAKIDVTNLIAGIDKQSAMSAYVVLHAPKYSDPSNPGIIEKEGKKAAKAQKISPIVITRIFNKINTVSTGSNASVALMVPTKLLLKCYDVKVICKKSLFCYDVKAADKNLLIMINGLTVWHKIRQHHNTLTIEEKLHQQINSLTEMQGKSCMNNRDSADVQTIESDIYILHQNLIKDLAFNALKSDRDFTSIAITFVYDIESLKYPIKQFSKIFFKKPVLNSRRSHYLMIEHSLGVLEHILDNSIGLRNIEQRAVLCNRLYKAHNFNIEEVLQEGSKNKLVIFMTRPQRDRVIALKQKIGARSEGVIVLLCVILALNAAFSGRDFRYDKNEDEMDMCREYWQNGEDGVNFKIRKYMQDYETELRGYISEMYEYLKVELDHAKQGIKLTVDKKRIDCLEKIIKNIEDKGFNK